MKTIEEPRLESDLTYRFEFLAEFIGFTPADASAVQAIGPFLGPMIPQIVDRTYEKLLGYDATARHFVERQSGFEGPAAASLAEMRPDDPQIRFRKEHLQRYLTQILTKPCDAKMVPYLDMVGKIHTSQAGNSAIEVPVVQMNALMGLLSDLLIETISEAPIDSGRALKSIRALTKLLWIQNDFINRHYQAKN